MLSYSTFEQKDKITSAYLGEDIYDLMSFTFVIPDSYSYDLIEVTEEYIARPDLLSYEAYGDTSYADIICKLNGISNPFELNVGMKLILPTSDSLIHFMSIPSVKDKDQNWGPSSSKSSTKTKNSKRQANEAIIGDSRFKIDKTNGVIIY